MKLVKQTMKLKPIALTVSLLASVGALASLALGISDSNGDWYFYALIASNMAFVASVPALIKLTKVQIVVFELAAILLAVSIAIQFSPLAILLAITPLLAVVATGSLRFQSYPIISLSEFSWLEPLSAIIIIGLYLAGNLFSDYGWLGWVAPALPLALSIVVGAMAVVDNRRNVLGNHEIVYATVGQTSPDFELLNEKNEPVKLSDFQGRHHVLLIFHSGEWCPFCNIMLRVYRDKADVFSSKNVFLLSVGPDSPKTNKLLAESMGLPFQMLSDPHLSAVRKFGIQVREVNSGAPLKNVKESPLPAAFLIDINGIVQYTSHPSKVGEFMRPDRIFPILDMLKGQHQVQTG